MSQKVEDPKTLKRRLKSTNALLRKLPDYLDVIGLDRVFGERSPWWRRIFWAILVLFGIGFGLYQVTSQIIYYYTWPVNVFVNISQVHEAVFPRVIVCNHNSVLRSSISDEQQGWHLDEIFADGLETGKYTDWDGFYDLHAHQLDSMLLECNWQAQPCSVANFTPQITDIGLCYSFNAGKKQLTTVHSNEEYGLRMILRVQDHEYSSVLRTPERRGFVILMNEPYEPTSVKEHGLSVLSNGFNNIAIDRKTITSLPEPWEDCEDGPLKYYPKYSSSGCHQECFLDYVIDKCGCRPPPLSANKTTTCSSKQLRACVEPSWKQFNEELRAKICKCPVACTTVIYSQSLSHAYLTNYFLERYNVTTTTSVGQGAPTEESNDIAVINVFFRSLVEEQVIHQPIYNALSLLCDIGGALGLILGTSILILFETFDVLIMHWLDTRGKK